MCQGSASKEVESNLKQCFRFSPVANKLKLFETVDDVRIQSDYAA